MSQPINEKVANAKRITRDHLIALTVQSTGFVARDVKRVVQVFIAHLGAACTAGKPVIIRSFGRFMPRVKKARSVADFAYNPETKKQFYRGRKHVPNRRGIKFYPAKKWNLQ